MRNEDDRITEARLEIEKSQARLAKALQAKASPGNIVAWSEEVEQGLLWVRDDTASFLRLAQAKARRIAGEAMVRRLA